MLNTPWAGFHLFNLTKYPWSCCKGEILFAKQMLKVVEGLPRFWCVVQHRIQVRVTSAASNFLVRCSVA